MVTAVRRQLRLAPILLGLVVVAIAAAAAYRGWDFYVLSIDDRPDHPDFRKLRASGSIGSGYGFVATVLVFVNLIYLLRRRLAARGLGSLKTWLDIHVFTGLTAAVLVAFHSTFQLRTPLATITAVSLAVVVVTGLIGRFLYALVPSSGETELAASLDGLEAALPGTRAPVLAALGGFNGPAVPASAGLISSLVAIPAWRRAARHRRDAVAIVTAPRLAALTDRHQRRAARKVVRQVGRDAARQVRASGSAALLRAWRALHRLFAILMLVTVAVHVGTAWYYGYRWIF